MVSEMGLSFKDPKQERRIEDAAPLKPAKTDYKNQQPFLQAEHQSQLRALFNSYDDSRSPLGLLLTCLYWLSLSHDPTAQSSHPPNLTLLALQSRFGYNRG